MSTPQQQRAFWLRHLHNWHWISSAICLVAMMLFAVTGFTLNHSADIEAHPNTIQKSVQIPHSLLMQLEAAVPVHVAKNRNAELPANVLQWIASECKVDADGKAAEWTAEEIYVPLPRPGGDAWLRLNLTDGELEYEKTERGVIAYLNDLHKGRNTGKAWSWFLDIFALACLIFCVTGLFLLKMHASNRRQTWPLVVGGVLVPLLVGIMFIH